MKFKSLVTIISICESYTPLERDNIVLNWTAIKNLGYLVDIRLLILDFIVTDRAV